MLVLFNVLKRNIGFTCAFTATPIFLRDFFFSFAVGREKKKEIGECCTRLEETRDAVNGLRGGEISPGV
jgi:hypothetical protein